MKELFDKVHKALSGQRTTWEERQRVWYQMRHDGLRRKNRQKWQSDLHFPMIDTVIEKLKPFYFNQVFINQQVAQFVATQEQMGEATESAAEYFDWTIRHNSNFIEEFLSAVDTMCLRGRVVMRARWDGAAGKLSFEAIDPLFLVVPSSFQDFDSSDWFCHVRHTTRDAYKRSGVYKDDDETLKRICGKGSDDLATVKQDKETREGITQTDDTDNIVLWDVYQRLEDDRWAVVTMSPCAPELALREPFIVEYRLNGKPFPPFVSFVMEVKDKGWYAPRGIAERLAPFESYATRMWCSKADYMKFVNQPLFTSTAPITNTVNMRMQPGDFLPDGVKVVDMPGIPTSFDDEINKTRLIGEQSLMMPDFGVSEENPGANNKTATETNYIRALASTGVDFKGFVFRIGLAKLFRMAWAILIQKAGNETTYWTAQDRKVLPQQAAHDNYIVTPAGSPDSWNKSSRVQRAMGRFQLLRGHPSIDQDELVKELIESDDPRLIKKLYRPSGMQAATEAEDEAMEILLLMAGYPAQALPNENHQLRIQILTGKLQQLGMTGAPVDPIAQQRMMQHIAQHLQFLQQQNPAVAKQIGQAMIQADPGQQPEISPEPQPPQLGVEQPQEPQLQAV